MSTSQTHFFQNCVLDRLMAAFATAMILPVLFAGAASAQEKSRYRWISTHGEDYNPAYIEVLESVRSGNATLTKNAGQVTAFYWQHGWEAQFNASTDFSRLQSPNFRITISGDRNTLTLVDNGAGQWADFTQLGVSRLVSTRDLAFATPGPWFIDDEDKGQWAYAAPTTTLASSTLNFGRVPTGKSKQMTLTVTNTGHNFSLLRGTLNSYNGANGFTSGFTSFQNLEKSATFNHTITFSETQPGARSLTVASLTASNGGQPNVTFTAHGFDKTHLINTGLQFGAALVGTPLSGTTSFQQSVPLSDNLSRPKLLKGQITSGEITIEAAPDDYIFNVSGVSATRNVSANFSTSGSKFASIPMSIDPEIAGAEGEGSYDLSANIWADIFDKATVTAPAGPFATGANITFSAAGGTRPANARLTDLSFNQPAAGTFSIPSLTTNSTVVSGGGNHMTGIVGFAANANQLNGQSPTGTFTATFRNDRGGAIAGSTAGDAGILTRTLSASISGVVSPIHRTGGSGDFAAVQNAVVPQHGAYSGLSALPSAHTANGGDRATSGSTFRWLAGNNAYTSPQTLGVAWRARLANESPGSANAALFPETFTTGLLSDVARVSGTADVIHVVSLTYDPALLSAAGVNASTLRLARRNANGHWVRAISGNNGQGSLHTGNSENGGFSDAGTPGLGDDLGRFGVDATNGRVWAVLNYPGDFAVVAETIAVSTTTSLATSQQTTTYGDSVTFTATVTAASGTPTGTVNFLVNGIPYAGSNVALTGSGNSATATYAISWLPATNGTPHTIQANYQPATGFATSSGTLTGGQTVNRKPLGVTGLIVGSKTYDGLTSTTLGTSNYHMVGRVGTDFVFVDFSSATAVFNDKHAGIDKPVIVSGHFLAGTAANNYTLQPITGITANISKRTLGLTFAAENKVYDGTTAATVSDVQLTNTIAGDDIGFNSSSAAFDSHAAGNRNIIVGPQSSHLTGADRDNYQIGFFSVPATIFVKPLGITNLNVISKPFDGNTQATLNAAAQLIGVIAADAAQVSLDPASYTATFDTPEIGGNKPVTVSNLALTGAAAANYSIPASANLTGNITEVPGLVVTTTADVVDLYDNQTSLREALAHAHSLGGPRTITFAPALAGETVTLSAASGTANDFQSTSCLRITGEITLQGPTTAPGITLAVSSAVERRHFLVEGSGSLTLSHLTLTGGNVQLAGSSYGGAVWSFGSLTVRNCTFTGNTAALEGGAIHAWSNSPWLHLENSTFSGNSAGVNGSAIGTAATTNTWRHLTITGNTGASGALWIFQTPVTMVNSIVAGNSPDGAVTFGSGAFTAQSTHNLLGTGPTGGLEHGENGNLTGIANPLLGPLQNNGGPTQTHALLPGSPAIDAGDPAFDPSALPTDQRGQPRVFKGLIASSASRIDIGAYELFAPTFTNSSLVVTPGSAPMNLATATNPTPAGGTFTGPGVSNGTFDPAGFTPLDTLTITYTATDAFGASNSSTITINLTEQPGLIVTTTADAVDAFDGRTSLREALAHAATLTGPQTITFSDSTANGATHFHDGTARTITLGGTQLVIASDVTITGPGAARLAIDGNQQSRVLRTSSGIVTLSGLTITHGNNVSDGGGIHNSTTLTLHGCVIANNSASSSGGGIFSNAGSLTLNGCSVLANQAASGGGILARPSIIVVTNSTISGNLATTTSNNVGGGIATYFDSHLSIINSTISDNRLSSASGIGAGGVFVGATGEAIIRNSTITNNTVPSGNHGGGLLVGNANCTVSNTIIAGNANNHVTPDVLAFRPVISLGYNLVGNADPTLHLQTGFPSSTDLTGTATAPLDPLLGPLQNNGGPTLTHALLPDSPAIDAGDPAFDPTALPTDQRGQPRVVKGNATSPAARIDIGAYEAPEPPITLTPYEQWAADKGLIGNDALPGEDPENDGLPNLLEFAFGTDPNAATGSITIDGEGNVTNPKGRPILYLADTTETAVDFRAVFSRRKNFAAARLIYTVQFSADLTEWHDHTYQTGEPFVMDGTAAEIDVVHVPFPLFVITARGYEKPRFFRVQVRFED